jgi:hypothetical protein
MHRRLLVATALGALALPVSPVLAGGGGRYVGRTADKRPVSFVVSGATVRSFTFQTRFKCRRGGFVARASFKRIALHGKRFNVTFASKDRAIRTTIKGVVNGRRATGTIARRATFNGKRRLDPAGTLICRSHVRWSAHR